LAPLSVTRTGRGRAEPSIVPRPVPAQAMHALLVSTLVVAVQGALVLSGVDFDVF
jgi:hypothetical protein